MSFSHTAKKVFEHDSSLRTIFVTHQFDKCIYVFNVQMKRDVIGHRVWLKIAIGFFRRQNVIFTESSLVV